MIQDQSDAADTVEALLERGAALEATGDRVAALEAFNRAAVLSPNDLGIALACTRVAAQKGDPATAFRYAVRAIELNPKAAGKAYIFAAQALASPNSDGDGLEWLDEKATTFAPRSAFEHLGLANLRLGHEARGLAWIRRHCLAQPYADGAPIPKTALERIWIYIDALHSDEEQDLRTGLLLARMLTEAGNIAAAVERLNALSDVHVSADVEALLGSLANQLGDPDEAALHLSRALELAPGRADLEQGLALTREGRDSPEAARKPPAPWTGPPLLTLIDPSPHKHLSNWWFLRRLAQCDRGPLVEARVFEAGERRTGWIHPVYCGTTLRLSPRAKELYKEFFQLDIVARPVIEGVRRGDGVLVIDHGCEGMFWSPARDDKTIYREFLAYLQKKGIPAHRVVILDGNLKSPEIAAEIAREAGLPNAIVIAKRHAWMEFLQIYKSLDRQNGGAQERLIGSMRSIRHGRLRPKHFLSLNGSPRAHRAALVGFLQQEGLLDRGLTSFSGATYLRNRFQNGLSDDHWVTRAALEVAKLVDWPNVADALTDLAAISPLEVDTDFNGVEGAKLSPKVLGRDNNDAWPYLDSYLSIVTDTNYSDGVSALISEKLSRPIANMHMFINVGEPGVLAIFREQGYRTFAPFIDERYDDIDDPKARMDAILREVKRLVSMPLEQLHDLYVQCGDILLHNYYRFMEGEALEADVLTRELLAIVNAAAPRTV